MSNEKNKKEMVDDYVDYMDIDAISDEIIDLLKHKRYAAVRNRLTETNVVDIAETLENINEELGLDKTILTFRLLPKDVSVEVFAYIGEDEQVEIIHGITQHEIDYIIDELAFDDMIDLLEELPANLVDKILLNTSKEERKLINTFLNYPENSAGSLMTIDYIDVKETLTAKQALAHIKEVGLDSETVYTVYVMDGKRKLKGVVSLRLWCWLTMILWSVNSCIQMSCRCPSRWIRRWYPIFSRDTDFWRCLSSTGKTGWWA